MQIDIKLNLEELKTIVSLLDARIEPIDKNTPEGQKELVPFQPLRDRLKALSIKLQMSKADQDWHREKYD